MVAGLKHAMARTLIARKFRTNQASHYIAKVILPKCMHLKLQMRKMHPICVHACPSPNP